MNTIKALFSDVGRFAMEQDVKFVLTGTMNILEDLFPLKFSSIKLARHSRIMCKVQSCCSIGTKYSLLEMLSMEGLLGNNLCKIALQLLVLVQL